MKLEEIKFNDELINNYKKKISKQLTKYIEENIINEYNLNDEGHNINHINYVLNRALEISDNYQDIINYNILYTCVMFHDIACHIDREKHEKLSSERVLNDKFLKIFFNEVELNLISSAIYDHRASLEYEPRNIYGKILSSADRKIDVKVYLLSSMSFYMKKHEDAPMDEVINNSYEFAIKKFGKNGYAVKKIYVDDQKYKDFLNTIQYLIDNKNIYFNVSKKIYKKLKK